MSSFQAKTGWDRPKKGKMKIIVPISSYPTSYGEFQKNRKKKIKKHHYGFFSSQIRLGKAEKERK